MYLNCEIFVESFALTANLMLLDYVDFDVILGIDFLEEHRAIFDCHNKEVLFRSLVCLRFYFVETRGLQCLVSFRR